MVRAYQEVEPLTIGELWAIAISLRILLVENLRRLAEQIVRSRAARQTADELADASARPRQGQPETSPPQRCAGSRAHALPTAGASSSSSACAIRTRRPTPALRWLEELLAAQGTTAEEMVRLEHQRQATMNVTVRNVITSMRLISWFDWARVRRERQPRRRGPPRAERVRRAWTSRRGTATGTRSRSSRGARA